MVARLGVNDNQFYSSPKCSVLEDAGNDLYSNFIVKEEYDPNDYPRKDCLLYLDSTQFTQSQVPMTILLITEVTLGLSSECNQGPVSSKAAFTIQFCEAGDTDPACPVISRTESSNVKNSSEKPSVKPSEKPSVKPSEKPPSSNYWIDYVAPIVPAVMISLVLILIIIFFMKKLLGCCWWNGVRLRVR